MKKIPTSQIADRVSQTTKYQRLRSKLHRLRRLTCGDVTALDSGGGGAAAETELSTLYRGSDNEFFDVMVSDVEEGRSNKLLQAVRTLALQTSMTFPDVNFEDLESNLATLNAQYFATRGQRCDVQHQAFTCLLDYLITGIGFAFVGVKDEYPCVQRIDPLDVVWDQGASHFDGINWAAWTYRRPLSEWQELFPNNPKFETLGDDDDLPVSVACYYDRHGKEGNLAWFLAPTAGVSGVSADDLIERVPNPYRESVGGEMLPCVPLTIMHAFGLPGVKVPTSVVEVMLPAQIALWQSEKRISDIVDKAAPYYEMEEDALDEAHLDAWKDGEPGTILVRKAGKPGLTVGGGIGIDQTLMEFRNANEREITAQSGINPYALGSPIKGVNFASETNAIQGAAGLVAGHIAKDVALFWTKLVKKFLAVGSQYDDQPIRLRFRSANESVELEFDESDPITDYLKPDSQVSVSEDSLLYQPKQQRIASALANLEVAKGLAQIYPAFIQKAAEDYLRAQGIKDVASWFERPMANPAQAVGESTQDLAA